MRGDRRTFSATWHVMRLQRSRALECAETRSRAAPRPCGSGFNGAAHSSARRPCQQWINLRIRRGFNGAAHSSARRQQAPSAHRLGHLGFNGAAHSSARRRPTKNQMSTHRTRFNGAAHSSARRPLAGLPGSHRTRRLQRSRALECAETLCRGIHISWHRQLQRSRALECAETGEILLAGTGVMSFNGAAHSSARRRGCSWYGA